MYRYRLEPYSRNRRNRYECPECGKAKKYTRYIDTLTGEYLPYEYGRCERQNNCTYHVNPYKTGFTRKTEIEKEKIPKSVRIVRSQAREKEQQASVVSDNVFLRSQQHYDCNRFVQYLLSIFDAETVAQLIKSYFIGTSSHWTGATVFWQVDQHGRIRSGKIMLYNPTTGRRVKKPFNHITWTHKVLKLESFVLEQCLFGEHLLTLHPEKPVAVVESEKTAIIASVYLPQFIWLAAGSQNNLSVERCMPLKGRRVFLFPDLGAYEDWTGVAENCSGIEDFKVVDLLERIATEQDKQKGLDLADYLVRFSVQQFQANEKAAETKVLNIGGRKGESSLGINGYPSSWDMH